MTTRMPAIFFGHGNPMNALLDNDYTRAWAALGAALPRPRAVLAISAHWYMPGTAVTAMAAPRTIHDFGGFPRELVRVSLSGAGRPRDWRGESRRYWRRSPSPRPELGPRSRNLVRLDATSFPAPTCRWCSSASTRRSPRLPLRARSAPAPAARRGRAAWSAAATSSTTCTHTPGAGTRSSRTMGRPFRAACARADRRGTSRAARRVRSLGEDARLSVPTPDHYLPLLYVLGAGDAGRAGLASPWKGWTAGRSRCWRCDSAEEAQRCEAVEVSRTVASKKRALPDIWSS